MRERETSVCCDFLRQAAQAVLCHQGVRMWSESISSSTRMSGSTQKTTHTQTGTDRHRQPGSCLQQKWIQYKSSYYYILYVVQPTVFWYYSLKGQRAVSSVGPEDRYIHGNISMVIRTNSLWQHGERSCRPKTVSQWVGHTVCQALKLIESKTERGIIRIKKRGMRDH